MNFSDSIMDNCCTLKNNSERIFLENIKLLRNNNNFLDVTLMCEDGVVISAHKLILASQSEKFKQILSQLSSSLSPSATPCIYLTGVSGTQLSDVIDYMYTGEARISQSKLAEFLKIGQKLQVNGLMGDETSSISSPIKNSGGTPRKISPKVSKSSSPVKSPVIISVKQSSLENSDNVKEENEELNLSFDEDPYEETEENISDADETMGEYGEGENYVEEGENDVEEETNFPSSSTSKDNSTPKKISPKEKVSLSPSESRVLVENLKILGLHRLSKEQLKDSKSRNIIKMVMSKPTPKLPCPVELMDSEQIKPWITKEILKNTIEQGKRPVKFVKWGTEACRPDFWPEELWPWHLVSNIAKAQKHKLEDVKVVEVLKVAITNRLRSKNLDPETYLDCDETKLKNKMRFRGMTTKNM